LAVERARVLEVHRVWLHRTVAWLQIPVLAIAAWAVVTTSESSRWLYHGGLLAMGLCWTVLVLAAVLDAGIIGRIGRLRWLVGLGVISYGVYLVHWPLLLAVHPFHNANADAALAVALSIVIAAISYRFYEAPIRFGDITPRLRNALLPAGAAIAAAVGAVVIATTALAPVGANASFDISDQPTHSTAPAAPHALRVLVIGDSTGGLLGGSLVRYANSHPDLVVENQGVSGCALSDARAQSMVRQREWSHVGPACRHWAARLRAERSFKPDVVLAIFGPAEMAELELGDHGAVTDVTHPDVAAAERAEVAGLRTDFPRSTFVWASAPRTFSGNPAIPQENWLINDPTRIAAWNRMVATFASMPRSRGLDLASYIENAPGGWHDRSWRPDGTHLAGTALSDAVAWIAANLHDLVRTSHAGSTLRPSAIHGRPS
jgi:hypothetical protein